MAQQFIFEGEKPARFDLDALITEVQQTEPGVQVSYINGYTRTIDDDPDPANVVVETTPDKLIFDNVPDQYTRAQVRNFITNHAPANTPEERAAMQRGDKLLSVVSEMTTAQIDQFKAALGI